MAKKKVGLANLNFNRIDPYGQQTASRPETKPVEQLLHLEGIYPDPDQPRKILPERIARALFAGQLTPAAALQELLNAADSASPNAALAESVSRLKGLADSIASQGQINPITVRPVGNGTMPDGVSHLIVTGERRWWAHVYLTMQNQAIREGSVERTPDRIKATIVPEGANIRALQLIENLQREDISVLERAYGLMALRDEVIVAHGQQKGAWGKVEEILGMSRAYRTRTLKVLELDPRAQQIVADYAMAERLIRPVAQRLIKQPELQVAALKQIVVWLEKPERVPARTIGAAVENLVEELLLPPARTRSRAPAKIKGAAGASSLRRHVRALQRDFDRHGSIETLRAELREPEHRALRDEVAAAIETLADILGEDI